MDKTHWQNMKHHSHSGKNLTFITWRKGTVSVQSCMFVSVYVCNILVSWNSLSERVFAYQWHELPCVCVCLIHNCLALMWGSKSIIPAAFTYHFTELYVQCKQRLSLHANEPVSHSLDKDSIHSEHGISAAQRTWYPRLQPYSYLL